MFISKISTVASQPAAMFMWTLRVWPVLVACQLTWCSQGLCVSTQPQLGSSNFWFWLYMVLIILKNLSRSLGAVLWLFVVICSLSAKDKSNWIQEVNKSLNKSQLTPEQSVPLSHFWNDVYAPACGPHTDVFIDCLQSKGQTPHCCSLGVLIHQHLVSVLKEWHLSFIDS